MYPNGSHLRWATLLFSNGCDLSLGLSGGGIGRRSLSEIRAYKEISFSSDVSQNATDTARATRLHRTAPRRTFSSETNEKLQIYYFYLTLTSLVKLHCEFATPLGVLDGVPFFKLFVWLICGPVLRVPCISCMKRLRGTIENRKCTNTLEGIRTCTCNEELLNWSNRWQMMGGRILNY